MVARSKALKGGLVCKIYFDQTDSVGKKAESHAHEINNKTLVIFIKLAFFITCGINVNEIQS